MSINNNNTHTKAGYHLYYEILETGFKGSAGVYANRKRAIRLANSIENAILLANGSVVEIEEHTHYWVQNETVPADYAFVQ